MKMSQIGLNRLCRLLVILMLAIASCTMKEVQPVQAPPPVPPPKPAKIAVALGAGASKGFAHIGVLKVLESNKIPIHIIIGTSAGSAIGSLYAYGYTAFEIQKMTFSVEQRDVVDLAIPENGFIKGEKLEEFINRTVKYTSMEKLKIPFYAVATDIQNGQEIVFGRGNTGTAVRASCSIPGVFRPVRIGERVYVDGGLVSPVPVEAAKKLGADVVIAVDVSSFSERFVPETTMETLLQSINIMYSKLAATQLLQADIVVRPKVGHISSSDFSKRHEAILEGEKAALEVLPRIMEIVAQLRQEGRLE